MTEDDIERIKTGRLEPRDFVMACGLDVASVILTAWGWKTSRRSLQRMVKDHAIEWTRHGKRGVRFTLQNLIDYTRGNSSGEARLPSCSDALSGRFGSSGLEVASVPVCTADAAPALPEAAPDSLAAAILSRLKSRRTSMGSGAPKKKSVKNIR